MLSTRKQIIDAERAAEVLGPNKTSLKAGDVVYLLSFPKAGVVHLKQSGVYQEIRMPAADAFLRRDKRANGPLLYVKWFGDTESSRLSCYRLSPQPSDDADQLIVTSLEGIDWLEQRPHKQRNVHPLVAVR